MMDAHTFPATSQLTKATYESGSGLLRVWFVDHLEQGYDYPNVPEQLWQEMKASDRPRNYFHARIHEQYKVLRKPTGAWHAH